MKNSYKKIYQAWVEMLNELPKCKDAATYHEKRAAIRGFTHAIYRCCDIDLPMVGELIDLGCNYGFKGGIF